jgi:hypothetical protein
MNEVGAQGDPCAATVLWSVVRPHLLYSASSPVPLIKYSIFHRGISSQSRGPIKMITWATKSEFSRSHTLTKDVWCCFCCDVAPPTQRAVNWRPCSTGLLLMAFAIFPCVFLVVHISPTRTGELDSDHQQSPMRVEGVHMTGCCPVPRRDRLRHCCHHLSTMLPNWGVLPIFNKELSQQIVLFFVFVLALGSRDGQGLSTYVCMCIDILIPV